MAGDAWRFHDTALAAMKLCQIESEKEGKEPWRNEKHRILTS